MSNQNGNSPEKMALVCPRCSQHFSITPTPPEIANNLRASVVTVSHENLVRCPSNKCRQPFILIIQGVQLMLKVEAVGDDIVEQIEGTRITKPNLITGVQ